MSFWACRDEWDILKVGEKAKPCCIKKNSMNTYMEYVLNEKGRYYSLA